MNNSLHSTPRRFTPISAHASLNDLFKASKAIERGNRNIRPKSAGGNYSTRTRRSKNRPSPLKQRSRSDGLEYVPREIITRIDENVKTQETCKQKTKEWKFQEGLSLLSLQWLFHSTKSMPVRTADDGNDSNTKSLSHRYLNMGFQKNDPMSRSHQNSIHSPIRSFRTAAADDESIGTTIFSLRTLNMGFQKNDHAYKSRHGSIHSTIALPGLCDIYSNNNVMKAYKTKRLNSESLDDSQNLQVLFLNQTSKTLVLCWVGFDHKLHSYSLIPPSSKTTITAGLDSSTKAMSPSSPLLSLQMKGGMHSEQTSVGHSFVLGTCPKHDEDGVGEYESYYDDDDDDDDDKEIKICWFSFCGKGISIFGKGIPTFGQVNKDNVNVNEDDDDIMKNIDKLKIDKLIGAYRPKRLGDMHDYDNPCLHMVTITEEFGFMNNSSTPQLIYHLSVNECKIDDSNLYTY